MTREASIVDERYRKLCRAPLHTFPIAGDRIDVSDKHGVYIIYNPRDTVLHVGRTVRGKKGLRQRLNNHLHGASSFVIQHFKGKGAKLRGTHKFRYIEVSNARARALLEAFAVGSLCPKHLGLGKNVVE